MLCIYMTIRRAASRKLRLIAFLGGCIKPIVFFTNAVKFRTSVYSSCIVIRPGVISIVGDSVKYASGVKVQGP